MMKYYSKRATKLIRHVHSNDIEIFELSGICFSLFISFFCFYIIRIFVLPLRRDQLGLITILGWWDSALEHCQHDNGSAIDLMFDPFDWRPMCATLYDWFPRLISINQPSMHCHPFDSDHIQCYNCFCVEINAREYPPTKKVNNQWIFIAGTFFK